MKPHAALLVASLALLSAAFAAARDAHVYPDPQDPLADTQRATDPVNVALARMNLRQRVAQLMLVTLEGSQTPNSSELAFLDQYLPAGVVIRKIRHPSLAAAYIERLKSLESASGIRLLVGGNLYELSAYDGPAESGWVQPPTPLSMAAAGSAPAVEAMANHLGDLMTSMGFNLHLGPSLALAPDLPGAAGSVLCIGGDPAIAADAAATLFTGFAAAGVAMMPMGFPGGGWNRKGDEPAVLLTPPAALHDRDLVPFKRVIDAGCRILHVGTAMVPGLSRPARPACLSRPVMQDLLRIGLGFDGIAVAGPMDSEDIARAYDPADAALEAIAAGADLVYWRGADTMVMRAVDRIVQAVADGAIEAARIDEAVRRVLAYKFGLDAKALSVLPPRKADRLDDRRDLLEAAKAVESHAITLLKNERNVLPLAKSRSMPIGVTGVIGVETFRKALEKHIKPIAMQEIKTAAHVGDIEKFEIERLTQHVEGIRTAVCIFTAAQRQDGQRMLVRALKAKVPQVVVVFLGYPRDAALFPEADAILLGYCDGGNCDATLAAVGDAITGRTPAEVWQPDAPFEIRAGQARVFRAPDVVRAPVGRLPVALSEALPAGYRLNFDPSEAIDWAEWTFPGEKRSRGGEVKHAFETPGDYPVTLRIADRFGRESEGVFTLHVSAEGN